MCEALADHEGSVSIGGLITNFRFADDIVVNAEVEEEAGVLVDRLDTTTTRYKMEIGPDKTKVMTNNPNGFQREIKIKGQRLEEVENKYIGAIISNEGSKPEILSRIAQTTAALSRLQSRVSTLKKGCLLSPTFFNIFLDRIMCEALDDHEGSVSIGGRLITNFRFADDIVVNAEEEEEAGVLIDRLDRTATR